MGDISPSRPQRKTRSASICAATGSLETVINSSATANSLAAPPTSQENNFGTPVYRRRRPATRSQSARITTGRSIKKKVQSQHQQQNLMESRSHCISEPRLNETETPSQHRHKLSQKKSMHNQTHRKSNAFLDVPVLNMHHLQVNDPDDETVDRLRTFSASKGGVVNRGDSFRRRRSRSNSLAPTSPMYSGPTGDDMLQSHNDIDVYRVSMLGAPGVGKAALVSQFKTSDCINAYDGPENDEGEQNISIILNGIESELKFVIESRENKDELEKADAYLVVYSVVDKASFNRAEEILSFLQDMDLIRTRPVILAANKIDLARSRAISAQDGKCVACTFRAKFIEVSVGINHNCDELLAGTLTQIRLKKEQNLEQKAEESTSSQPQQQHWYKKRSVVRASMKARQMITWILGKEDAKFRHCENLQVL